MALAVAIFVLVIGAAFASLAFFTAFEEERLSASSSRLAQSFGVGEEGALEVVRTWDPQRFNPHDPYPFDSSTVPLAYPGAWTEAPHGTGAYGGHVFKLNGELYFIEMAGEDRLSRGSGRGFGVLQRVGVLAHVRPIVPAVAAAVTIGRGKGSRLAGSVMIDGNDRLPPGWDPCGPPDTVRAGFRSSEMPALGEGVQLRGAPDFSGAPAAAGPSVLFLGGLDYSQLVTRATVALPGQTFLNVIAPVVVAGRCDEGVTTNWGGSATPNAPCGGYLPVVHILGSAVLEGGNGQGTLLVDGDLTLLGRVRWDGALLVGGSLRAIAGPLGSVSVWGAVMAGDSIVVDAGLGGSVAMTYSKCAVVKALESVAPVLVLPSRGWIGLSDTP